MARFPDPSGKQFADAVQKGAEPEDVVPDEFFVVRGGSASPPDPPLSCTVGPTLESAAAAIPHGRIRFSTAGEIRMRGGTIRWVPEVSRHGTVNQQHVDVYL